MSVTAPGGTFELAGRTVARVGFGAMQLPGVRDRPAPPREVAIAVLRRAVELGVNHIDTAQFYGDGVANELIREALAPYPDDLVLVSKVGAAWGSHGGLVPAQRPEELRAAVEANLSALGVDRIDVINMRRLDRRAGPHRRRRPGGRSRQPTGRARRRSATRARSARSGSAA